MPKERAGSQTSSNYPRGRLTPRIIYTLKLQDGAAAVPALRCDLLLEAPASAHALLLLFLF